jgi:DNA repair protein RadD
MSKPLYQLRDYQQYAIDCCENFIKYRDGNGFVVAAGGSGKSIIISKLAESLLPLKIIILTRSERLLKQNREKISENNKARSGIYCASIGEYDYNKEITFATIQSISRLEENLRPDIILIDEVHDLHPDSESETQYWKFIKKCGNPRIIGFTASPYRTSSGNISWGEEICNIPMKPLIDKGYLCPPTNKCPITPDLSTVDVKLGDYVDGQLEGIFLEKGLLKASIESLIKYGNTRNHAIVFCQSRKHAAIVNQALLDNGQQSVYVDGETPKDKLEDIINSKPKFICNNNLMTTGYDLPWVDMVAILRSTLSKGLFEQMALRGTRLYENKKDFLLLDMGNNLIEHGALGSPYEGKSTKGERVQPKGRICPVCETYVKVEDMRCADCGHEFPPAETPTVDHKRKHDTESNTVYDHNTPPEMLTVKDVSYYTKPNKKTRQPMIVVNYMVNERYEPVTEYFMPYHENEWVAGKFAAYLGESHVAYNSLATIKMLTAEQLVEHCEIHNKKPISIVRSYNKKGFPEIRRAYAVDQPDLGGDTIPW